MKFSYDPEVVACYQEAVLRLKRELGQGDLSLGEKVILRDFVVASLDEYKATRKRSPSIITPAFSHTLRCQLVDVPSEAIARWLLHLYEVHLHDLIQFVVTDMKSNIRRIFSGVGGERKAVLSLMRMRSRGNLARLTAEIPPECREYLSRVRDKAHLLA